MLPFILAAVGGYLIGDSIKSDATKMADGGIMAKGGNIDIGAYKIFIKKTNSPSNYNVFASLFRKGEKMPLLGTTFKDTTSKEEIKEWFEKRIKMLDANKMADGGVMADLQKQINEHKEYCLSLYPNAKMGLENGFYGILKPNGNLAESIYVGNDIYEIDGVVYKEKNSGVVVKTKLES